MNKIIESFLNNHVQEYELKDGESDRFEHFINFIVTRNYTSRHFDPSVVCTEDGEIGIDGVAIVINDIIVSSLDEVKSIFNSTTKDIKVDFIFTQAKTSEGFDSKEMSIFTLAVKNYFNSNSKKFKMNSKMDELVLISEYIFQNSIKLSQNPNCYLYYASTGIWQTDDKLQVVIDDAVATLTEYKLFKDISFIVLDQDKISTAYRGLKNSIKRSISIEYSATIPNITGVNEAYLGVIKCIDYIKLISNEEGKIISALFEDNVRYFQGSNPVNLEIEDTINNGQKQTSFSLLNNGVTIVAKDIRRTGNNFVLTDFQVVNGCQTSFMLFDNKNAIKNDTFIVIKLVSTQDPEITDNIIKATNRQTPVLTEAFETLRDFHKNLEVVYSTYDSEYRLYYERRSKQYDSQSINKNKVVSFPVQINAYIAMFLGEPHSTHRYYGELLESYRKRLFKDGDVLEQYCISAMYLYYVEKWLKETNAEKKYKSFKYHFILVLRCLVDKGKLPRSNSNDMKRLCTELYRVLSTPEIINLHMSKAIEIIEITIDECKTIGIEELNLSRSKEFTNTLTNILQLDKINITFQGQDKPLRKGEEFDCIIKGYNASFVYVDIIDHKEPGQIHISELDNKYIASISNEVNKGDIIKAVLLSDIKSPVYGYSLSKRKAIE